MPERSAVVERPASPSPAPAGDLGVAIIGMACRFPGASSVEAFWQNLRDGVESIACLTDEELRESGIGPEIFGHSAYVKAAAVLEDADRFDARFFRFTAREAEALDPQHRLFLELAWEALERAGYDPARHRGRVGVFGGSSGSAHGFKVLTNERLRRSVSPLQALLSSDRDFLVTRIAYKLNLTGPAVTIQTACSTSLAAIHLACQSLLAGECEMALAGGVSVNLPQKVGYVHEPDGILSRDGHCRAFDADASGTVKGNGVGIVVLKRLPEALRDGDRIDAVIRGSAMNNDGAGRVGFTAPSVDGQVRVVRLAQALADVEPESVGYIEAHGTGTALGDPIEIAALSKAVGAVEGQASCAIGSVKTNIGHLDAAAGVASLIKVALMLRHRELVPSLHFRSPNPRIDFANSPFYVNTRTTPWTANGRPRRAGVSSLGMGGTNVHMVLEEAPEPPRTTADGAAHVLVMSAQTEAALERASDNLAEHLQRDPEQGLGDVAFTLWAGRHAFRHRRAVVAREVHEAARALAARDARNVWSGVAPEEGRPVAFLFTGQGAQYANMGRGLYASEPVFRAEVDACCERLVPLLGLDLRPLIYPDGRPLPDASERINETRLTQPALFTIEYALARLWASWGVVPEAMIGHSVGEYVAACLAGVMSRDAALALVAERARLMNACPRGAMLAVALSDEAVRPFLRGSLELSVVNGPDACVVGGLVGEVEGLAAELLRKDVPHRRLATSHAFHCGLMRPAVGPFAARVADLRLERPRVPFVSSVTGTWITPEEATDPGYWARQLVETVRFGGGLGELLRDPRRVALEVGPGTTLVSLARRRLAPGSAGLALASLPHSRDPEPDEVFIRRAAARLWTAGVVADCVTGGGRAAGRRVLLPTYPFDGRRYSIDDPPSGRKHPSARAAKESAVERWLYVPSWRRSAPSTPGLPPVAAEWCVFAAGAPWGDALIERLRVEGARVSVVRPGAGFARRDGGEWAVDPARRADFERVLDEIEAQGGRPERFVHLWASEPAAGAPDLVDPAFLGVLHLAQALGPRQGRETSLTVVSSGALDVTGGEPLSPRRAAVLGLLRVIPQEYPLLACRHVDVEATGGHAEVTGQIWAEAASAAPVDPTVAYRGRYRWVQAFDPVGAPAPASAARLRARGVYLITGGLGKVGLALAEYLARTVKARLVLVGRSGLPERSLDTPEPDAGAVRVRAVRELHELGSEVEVVRADAADLEQMRAVLALARGRFGELHGVIHAAGEIDAGVLRPLSLVERADCERQLRPKACGVEVLDELLGDDPLDFVLLASSLSTVLGGLGFAAYAAANHHLDAFARRQHQRGRHWWTSVDWDGWAFGGSSRRTGESAAPSTAMSPEEGCEVFARILGLGPLPQVVVSTAPLDERLEQWTRPAAVAARKGKSADRNVPVEPRPVLNTVYVAPEGPVERRLAELWGELLGVDRVGRDDNFFELGGSSLLAVHLMGKLRKEFDADLSVATLFEAPTVRALGQVIHAPARVGHELERSQDRGQVRRRSRRDQRRTSDAVVE